MRIRFNEISPYGSYYEVREIEGLASELDFLVKGNLLAQCTLKRKGDTKVEMQGCLKACLVLNCDRCLVPYDVDVDTELLVLLEAVSSDCSESNELECSVQDLDSIILDETVVDVDDILRQQLYLALPLKSLCSEHCRGICVKCGVDLNVAGCMCGDDRQGLPFAVLARLNDKNIIEK